jgi:DNA-directed RNA polymerase subunit RPC12/RpoP
MPKGVYLVCPGCQTTLRAALRLIGRYRDCPICSQRVLVKAPPLSDAEPMLVLEEPPDQRQVLGIPR